jgi:RNase P/RNase MRP subunit p30
MQIINTTNLNEARTQILKLKKEKLHEKIALISQDDEFNRKALEIKGLNALIINELIYKKDYSKQRNSSLNEVLAKICTEKNIEILIEIENILKMEEKDKARALARLKQNIILCKRTGTKLSFLKNEQNLDSKALESLMITLGANTKQAAKSTK